MGSEVENTLPIISLQSKTLEQDLYTACKETGFFYLTDHGIPEATLSQVIDHARRFFLTSSPEEKQRIQRKSVEEGGDGARGYQVLNENVTKGQRDYHEAVDFYREWDGPAEPEFLKGANLWPDEPRELRAVYADYLKRCKAVGTDLVRAMGRALGVADVFVDATRQSFWVLRMIGYPPLAHDEAGDGISCGEHTDYGCVTLLLADETQGALQVQLKDGSWLTANPIPGAFVVNIGDMMAIWTNGEWQSTNHRVIHRGSNYRVSVPFFFEPDFDAVVEPLPECIRRTGGKAKFDRVVYGKHLTAKANSNFYAEKT